MNEQEKYDLMVYVGCMTFNHAPYIVDAMNGFTAQETNFPFVCAIVDDVSTDGEQEVIKKYLEEYFDLEDKTIVRQEETDDYVLTFVRHKTNLNCYFAVLYLKYNHYGIKKSKDPYLSQWQDNAKYIAICEGDDYWIDPLKLQKQVDFMESHSQNSLCFCAHKDLFPTGEIIDVFRYETNHETCPMHDLIMGGGAFMATNSMFYRKSMYTNYKLWAKNCHVGDLPMMLTLAHNGSVGYIADVMCVYRRSLAGSWTNRMNSNIKNRFKHHQGIQTLWSQFDKFSNYQYHSSVMMKKKKNRKEFFKYEVLSFLSKMKEFIH